MFRPIVKNVVRLGLFAAAVTTVACSNPTAPNTPINIKKAALKDVVPPIEGDTSGYCRSGWTLINGRFVCE